MTGNIGRAPRPRHGSVARGHHARSDLFTEHSPYGFSEGLKFPVINEEIDGGVCDGERDDDVERGEEGAAGGAGIEQDGHDRERKDEAEEGHGHSDETDGEVIHLLPVLLLAVTRGRLQLPTLYEDDQ